MSKKWNKGDKVYFVHWDPGCDTFSVYGEATVTESKVSPLVVYGGLHYKPGSRWIFSSPVDAEIAGRRELIKSLESGLFMTRTKLEFYEHKVKQFSEEITATSERIAKLRRSIHEEEEEENKEDAKND